MREKEKVLCTHMFLSFVWRPHTKANFLSEACVCMCVSACMCGEGWCACTIALHSCPGMNGVYKDMRYLKDNTSAHKLQAIKMCLRKFSFRLGMRAYGGCTCTPYQDTVYILNITLYKHKVLEA